MFNHIVDLVGRSFHASIGEPWNFESAAGRGRLVGKIQQILLDQSGNVLLLCDVEPFLFREKTVSSVAAVNRYQSSQDVVECLWKNRSAGLNFVFRLSGEVFTPENVQYAIADRDNCSFLVGTMRLE